MLKSIYNKLFKAQKNELSFKQGLDLTGLPIITFYQNDKCINFILDTGANFSVINKAALPKYKYILTTTPATIYGMEGNLQTVKECVMDLEYKNTIYTQTFLISNVVSAFDKIKREHGVDVHGVLGSDFFKKYQYILDFKELIAYSQR